MAFTGAILVTTKDGKIRNATVMIKVKILMPTTAFQFILMGA
jgi:hypothetical protein